MKHFNIAVIEGDGIGREVVPEALRELRDLYEDREDDAGRWPRSTAGFRFHLSW